MITALVFLAIVLFGVGTVGWKLIDDQPTAPRRWRICKGGYAHFEDKVVQSGDPGADVTHAYCDDCLALWGKDLRRSPSHKKAA